MAELVDALDSKSCFFTGVQVRFLFWAQGRKSSIALMISGFFCIILAVLKREYRFQTQLNAVLTFSSLLDGRSKSDPRTNSPRRY